MTNRRTSREVAVQILYQMEFDPTLSTSEGLQLFKNYFVEDAQSLEYSEKLVTGVKELQTQIDELIQKNSHNWKLHRISHVDRNILRISVFEMLRLKEEVPVKASINEAIEIAKKFSTEDSSQFVNGVLDQISKSV